MLNWIPLDEDTPHGVELLLWVKADFGEENPVGCILGVYKDTGMGEMWVQKDVTGGINNGLRADLITHYCVLDIGEPDERPIC